MLRAGAFLGMPVHLDDSNSRRFVRTSTDCSDDELLPLMAVFVTIAVVALLIERYTSMAAPVRPNTDISIKAKGNFRRSEIPDWKGCMMLEEQLL